MSTYLGDGELGQLLEASSSTLSVSDVQAIVRGVAAAPIAMDPTEWLTLVRDEANDALDEQLMALLADVIQESHFGLGQLKPPKTRLNALGAELNRRGVDGFIIPRADEH